MSSYLPEPAHRHDAPPALGVLLINLGTPEAPTPRAVRTYLKQFLSDPRVVEIPRLLWWPILNGIILNTRPKKSAAKYASIWTDKGSPLRFHTEQQARLLKGYLGERGIQADVAWAMRYGDPDVSRILTEMKHRQVRRILVVPMYPQYAASTTATALDMVFSWFQRSRNQPELRTVRNFHDHPGYLNALEDSVRRHWRAHGLPDAGTRLVMSFHGLPRRSLDLGDPYFCECQKTGRLLAERLKLDPEQYQVCFQSRFGKAQWLQPYTAPTLEALARKGVRRVDVICPGFVADCLETLEEIALEGKQDFLQAGGQEYHYIPALNENPVWIHALADLVETHLAGWPRLPPETADRVETANRARQLGAQN
ncbi:ferrochelatase [Azovibrio restrictus]|uniref:ferrochelatase n=1 Tax=Azovibrio restrictus TaxID=146938 RepID=UPI0026EC7CC0|nr:ferrochelatase [Azovibrio restrictus]MDD3482027.1 ferrochelatase [Azovibrio restrictus]